MRTTWPTSAKQLAVVHYPFGFYSVTHLSVQCSVTFLPYENAEINATTVNETTKVVEMLQRDVLYYISAKYS